MTSSEAKAHYELLLCQGPDQNTPHALIWCMLDFYRNVRAEDCLIPHDRDMLLYQWGTYDWGQGRWFDLNITRQFILEGGDDDDIFQLSVNAKYHPSAALEALESGNRWCGSTEELPDFEKFINNSAPIQQLGMKMCDKLEVGYWCAG